MSTQKKFDGEAFFAALDATRVSRRLTWKKVAEESHVPASTLTRLSQGRRPDVDSLSALCAWSGLSADLFMQAGTSEKRPAEPLSEIAAHLRADPNLSRDAVKALEALIKTAYEQLRKQ